mmetsp:Transcript_14523/g.50116  ORF Transcript_14523/g.50116 Transcript_14523/m.50116 type:complete len:223 (+) Transcript_14523:342-1010(+)
MMNILHFAAELPLAPPPPPALRARAVDRDCAVHAGRAAGRHGLHGGGEPAAGAEQQHPALLARLDAHRAHHVLPALRRPHGPHGLAGLPPRLARLRGDADAPAEHALRRARAVHRPRAARRRRGVARALGRRDRARRRGVRAQAARHGLRPRLPLARRERAERHALRRLRLPQQGRPRGGRLLLRPPRVSGRVPAHLAPLPPRRRRPPPLPRPLRRRPTACS